MYVSNFIISLIGKMLAATSPSKVLAVRVLMHAKLFGIVSTLTKPGCAGVCDACGVGGGGGAFIELHMNVSSCSNYVKRVNASQLCVLVITTALDNVNGVNVGFNECKRGCVG